MNVRLSKIWQWQSATVYDEDFYINHYTAKIQMHTTAMDTEENATAYERMDHWFQQVMQDAVMISAENARLKAYAATGNRLLIFPGDPVDQLVGIMLCLKLNSITEGRLIITDVDLSSANGQDMTYRHNQAEETGPMADPGWWQDPRPTWSHPSARVSPSKVVNLTQTQGWHTFGLDWPQKDKPADSAVVFADFDRDDNQ
jgi:hypothetical protein